YVSLGRMFTNISASAKNGWHVTEGLEGDAGLPGYRRLAALLAEEIAAGMYSADTPLPTDTELMEKYGLGRQTVRRAFQELVAEHSRPSGRRRGAWCARPVHLSILSSGRARRSRCCRHSSCAAIPTLRSASSSTVWRWPV